MAPDPKTHPAKPIEDNSTQFMPVPGNEAKSRGPANSQSVTVPPVAAVNSDLTLTEEVTLGEFRLLRRLGRGGMSEVYLAEQTLLKRHVAIKVLRPELMLDESLRQRFQKEALAVAGLNHPNIVQVYTVGEADGRFYIAQEYVNGQNLREYMTRKGPPDLPVAVHIMKHVAAALQAAGQAGIVHRDIKPENIMLARKGDVKVADFGLAKRSQQSDSQQLTQLGTTMGTPLYMSPEQVNGRSVDQRSDLYSFGVTAYHMLAGYPPFRGENAISIAVQHLREAPKPLEKIRPDLPPLLCRIIHKLMEKDPDHRYQSAAAVIKDLKRLANEKFHGADTKPLDDRKPDDQPNESFGTRLTRPFRNPLQFALAVVDMPPRKQITRLVITCVVILALFAGLGWMRRPINPLQSKPTAGKKGITAADSVPKRDSARDQWFLASSLGNSTAAWEAVIRNFPDDKVFTPLAMIELGLLHLAENRLPEAQANFDQLVSYGEIDSQWQAAGWMGQAIVLNQKKDYAGSQQLLSEKAEVFRKRLPPRLRELGLKTLQSNETHLKQGVDEKLLKIFE